MLTGRATSPTLGSMTETTRPTSPAAEADGSAPIKLGLAELRAIAVEASCDPRTVQALLAGKPVRPLVRNRIEPALTKRGIVPPPRSAP